MLAHGVGSRGDLPLPLWMFTWASAIALVVSFVALGVLWTEPRLARAAGGARRAANLDAVPQFAGSVVGRVALGAARAAALALFVVCLWAGWFGVDETNASLLPVTLYVVVWVGAQLVNGIVGDVWRAISPITTIAMAVAAVVPGSGRRVPPSWLGHWPAAAGLFVFLFYELAHPSGSQPRTLAIALTIHLIVSVAAAVAWGVDWIADNEPFAVLFSLLAAMGVLWRHESGRHRLRPPISGLATMAVRPGTLATILVVLGGTSYDGFSESEAGRELLGSPTGWGGAVTSTIGLAVSMLLIALLYGVGVWWTARVTDMGRGEAADAFTPSLVPIVFGYAIAHYAQLLVDETQTFVFRLSDPGGLGWDLFGGADGRIDFNIISVDVVAWIQVLAILFGHVGAVVVAHDRAVELFPAGETLRSQFAMLLVMVAYSTLGLWLLLNA